MATGKRLKKKTASDTPALLVTVGSTRFDALIEKVLSEDFYAKAKELGFNKMIVQAGKFVDEPANEHLKEKKEYEFYKGFKVQLIRYTYSMEIYLGRCDLVISHGGAATCLEVLKIGKKLLIVPNENLMNNHQWELADVICDEKKWAVKSDLDSLQQNLELLCRSELEEFPITDQNPFVNIFESIIDKYKLPTY